MILFLLKSSTLLVVFFMFYKLLLQTEKTFFFNRLYLILTMIASVIIPTINFSAFSLSSKAILLQKLIISGTENIVEIPADHFNFRLVFWGFYFFGLSYFAVKFIVNLYSILKIIHKNQKLKSGKQTFVLVENQLIPYTFMSYIFIEKSDFLQKKIPAEIISHEKTHARQWHSFDVLIVELFKIVFWFNPIFNFFKKAIQLNHEFLADQKTLDEHQNIVLYQNILLQYSQFVSPSKLASSFNFSITKKRFVMMTTTSKSNNLIFKKLLVMPLFLLTFMCFSNQSFSQSETARTSLGANGVQPQYPGGIAKFYQYVMKNVVMPKNVIGSGKVQMTFVVEKDGSLSDIKSVKATSGAFVNPFINLLKKSPKWIPGKVNGKAVRVAYRLPISIVVQN